jgi:hypothetical protein
MVVPARVAKEKRPDQDGQHHKIYNREKPGTTFYFKKFYIILAEIHFKPVAAVPAQFAINSMVSCVNCDLLGTAVFYRACFNAINIHVKLPEPVHKLAFPVDDDLCHATS